MIHTKIELTEQEDGSWLGEADVDGVRLIAHGETAEEAVFLLGAAAYRAGAIELDEQLMDLPAHLREN